MSDAQDPPHDGQSGTELGGLLAKALELLVDQQKALVAGNLQAVQDAMPQVMSLLSQTARQQVTPADASMARQVAQAHRALMLSLAAGKEGLAAQIRQMSQSRRLVRAYMKSGL